MSKDLNLTVPILASIFTAKVIADTVAKPLYKYQLKGKMLPYLDPEPEVNIKGHRYVVDYYCVEHWQTVKYLCTGKILSELCEPNDVFIIDEKWEKMLMCTVLFHSG